MESLQNFLLLSFLSFLASAPSWTVPREAAPTCCPSFLSFLPLLSSPLLWLFLPFFHLTASVSGSGPISATLTTLKSFQVLSVDPIQAEITSGGFQESVIFLFTDAFFCKHIELVFNIPQFLCFDTLGKNKVAILERVHIRNIENTEGSKEERKLSSL